ncbi:MAG: hypothetical protein ACPGWR_13270 [Ardenticatenaceae bacterium]
MIITWGDEVNALRLGIALEQYGPLKKAVSLQLYLTNVSRQNLHIVDTYLLREHEIAVLTETNQPVPMTPEGQKALQAAKSPFYRRMSKLLKPQAVYQVNPTVPLDQWFELEPAQTYKVCARRKGCQSNYGLLLSTSAGFCIPPFVVLDVSTFR